MNKIYTINNEIVTDKEIIEVIIKKISKLEKKVFKLEKEIKKWH